jgi:hypothetical protein
MYRVFLIPTEESPKKEIWLVAEDVHETDDAFWDFVDQEDHVILRLEKSGVTAIEIAEDRRKPRYQDEYLVPDVFSGGSWLDRQFLDGLLGPEDLDRPTYSS